MDREHAVVVPIDGGVRLASHLRILVGVVDAVFAGLGHGRQALPLARQQEAVDPAQKTLPRPRLPLLDRYNFGPVIDGSLLPDFELIRRYFGTVGLGMETVPEGWSLAGLALPRSQQEPEVARRPVTPVGR